MDVIFDCFAFQLKLHVDFNKTISVDLLVLSSRVREHYSSLTKRK